MLDHGCTVLCSACTSTAVKSDMTSAFSEASSTSGNDASVGPFQTLSHNLDGLATGGGDGTPLVPSKRTPCKQSEAPASTGLERLRIGLGMGTVRHEDVCVGAEHRDFVSKKESLTRGEEYPYFSFLLPFLQRCLVRLVFWWVGLISTNDQTIKDWHTRFFCCQQPLLSRLPQSQFHSAIDHGNGCPTSDDRRRTHTIKNS